MCEIFSEKHFYKLCHIKSPVYSTSFSRDEISSRVGKKKPQNIKADLLHRGDYKRIGWRLLIDEEQCEIITSIFPTERNFIYLHCLSDTIAV